MNEQEFRDLFPQAKKTEARAITKDGFGDVIAFYDNDYYERTWLPLSDKDRFSDCVIPAWMKRDLPVAKQLPYPTSLFTPSPLK